MKVLELFAGTRSIGREFQSRGHEVFAVEWDRKFADIDLYADVGTLSANDVLGRFGRPDVIWASPDCASYSVAALGHHRDGINPKTEYARFCDKVNEHMVDLILELKPRYWFVENPRAMMRKMPFIERLMRLGGGTMHTVTYCQYGERRMKPTDIFTNHPSPHFRPPCRNGDPCHDRAPRGSKESGTQAIRGSMDRARIPAALCRHIADICEAGYTLELCAKDTSVKSLDTTGAAAETHAPICEMRDIRRYKPLYPHNSHPSECETREATSSTSSCVPQCTRHNDTRKEQQ